MDMTTRPSGIPLFQRFFRSVASIEVDKQDIKRYWSFVDSMIDDIAVAGRNTAKWNARDLIEPPDLPITRAIQERMREFDKLDEADEIRVLLGAAVRRPPDDVTFADDTLAVLPELFGGLSIALARSFTVIDPHLTNPRTEHWDRVFDLFRLTF